MWRAVLGLVAIIGCNSGPCPGDPPANGATCEFHTGGVGDSCEYGGDEHGLCTTFASCGIDSGSDSTPRWHLNTPAATCSTNAATCPAAFGAMEGTACSPTNSDCEYDEGVCGCETCDRQGTQSSYWHCRPWTDVAPGCPVPRQRIGESCDHEGLYCNYGKCCQGPSLGGSLECKNGAWQPFVDTACACVIPQCP
jgi:hypothetical protein